MLYDVLHQYDGPTWLSVRLVVDLESQQNAGAHHVLEDWIPGHADLIRTQHFHLGVRNRRHGCKQSRKSNFH